MHCTKTAAGRLRHDRASPKDGPVSSVPTGKWKRSQALFSLSAGIAKHEMRHQIRTLWGEAEAVGLSELRARIAQAKLLAENLGRLKGAFMKAGQLLSIDSSEFLPPEAIEILSRLQGQAEPIDFSVIRGVLEEELGEVALRQFTEFERVPVASASIGQVHRAQAFGADVAVKIQYPGIAASIDTDIAVLEGLARSWSSLVRRGIELAPTFDELRTILHWETDYVRERSYLDRFASLLASDPRFEVPHSVPQLSTARVLTMSWATGLPLDAWMRNAPSLEERRVLAATMLDLYCSEFFEWGIVQTDPNFGNFLIRPAERRIVLLDFGATVEYEPEFRRGYVELLRCVATGSRRRIIEQGIGFDLIDKRESEATFELFVEMLRVSVEPFQRANQPFAFSDAGHFARSLDTVKRFLRSLRYTPPPRRLLFLHRKLGGVFHLLKHLGVQMNLSPYWDRMVAG